MVAVFDEENRHAGILADGNLFLFGDTVIFDQLSQYFPPDSGFFPLPGGFQGVRDVTADFIITSH